MKNQPPGDPNLRTRFVLKKKKKTQQKASFQIKSRKKNYVIELDQFVLKYNDINNISHQNIFQYKNSIYFAIIIRNDRKQNVNSKKVLSMYNK